MTLKTEHFYVRFAEHPELPEDQQNDWAGCTGCAGTASPGMCKKLKDSAKHNCLEDGLIYTVDLELH